MSHCRRSRRDIRAYHLSLAFFFTSRKAPAFTIVQTLKSSNIENLVLTLGQWFFYRRLDKKHNYPDIPRYTQADAAAQAGEYSDFIVGGTDRNVTLGDLWKTKKIGGLQSMDEATIETWTHGRIACVGDSAHKVTANSGYGGNICLESAATVTNSLYKLLHSPKETSEYQNGSAKHKKVPNSKPDFRAVEAALKAYRDNRIARSREQIKSANEYTRIEDFRTIKERIFAKYIAPNLYMPLVDMFSDGVVGAPGLDFLPPKKATIGISMPFNPNYGITTYDALWKRAFFALPLLALFFLARQVMTIELGDKLGPLFEEALSAGAVKDGASIVPLRAVYTGWEGLDTFMMPLITAFTPSIAGLGGGKSGPDIDPSAHQKYQASLLTFLAGLTKKNLGEDIVDLYAPQRMQAISFLTDYFAINAIWMIESGRRGNVFTFARM